MNRRLQQGGRKLTVVADASRTDTPPARRAARGSSLSDRQVAYSVRDGRLVTVTLPNGEQINGYVMGSDDYHWALVTLNEEIVLVHKSVPSLCIDRRGSMPAQSERIKSLTAAFRQFVMETHFASSTKPTKA